MKLLNKKKMINNDIQERYVSFEVAKLLREKGFNVPQPYRPNYYNYKGEFKGDLTDYVVAKSCGKDTTPFRNFLAPTQSVAVEWVRVNLGSSLSTKAFLVDNDKVMYKWQLLMVNSHEFFETPQEAIEAGLLHLLS